MSQNKANNLKQTFRKSERLHSKKDIQELFQKGSSFYLYPFKVLFLEAEGAPRQVLVSVSKRKFKRAVDRNLIKRRIKEAYRLNKHILTSDQEQQPSLLIAYIYTGKEIPDYHFLEKRLSKSLRRLVDNSQKQSLGNEAIQKKKPDRT